jgi:hypothetical protein
MSIALERVFEPRIVQMPQCSVQLLARALIDRMRQSVAVEFYHIGLVIL